MFLAHVQAAARRGVLQPQAQVHPGLGGRLHHGERTAGGDQRDDGLAGLHRHRPERGQDGQHRVQDRPQLRPVGVLAVDQLAGVGGETPGGVRPPDLVLELGPAREAVLAGYGQLGGGQRGLLRDLPDPPQRPGIAAGGGAVQLAGLRRRSWARSGRSGSWGMTRLSLRAGVRVPDSTGDGPAAWPGVLPQAEADSVLPADPAVPSRTASSLQVFPFRRQARKVGRGGGHFG